MSNDKIHEEFEAWAIARFINSATMKPLQRSADEPDGYHYPVLNTAWEAWKASREALVIELPQQSGANLDWNQAIRYCHQAIEDAGVKVSQ
ncbi:hypothetical protein [Pseudomonas savastanoi]|uniref:Phage protein n=1 Tax=Pseudomonas savastanoi TaxID=29438 RepID=A0AAW3LYR5_PSESS|nr:hypothetical protein [Pseudomonas savastanoi]KTC59085.1 hypothetical protein AO287_21575 [Pseudomonas savastanoi]